MAYKIETPEQYEAASRLWESLERGLNEERFGPMSRKADEARQIEIERAMTDSPFEFDEDGKVVLKGEDSYRIHDRIG